MARGGRGCVAQSPQDMLLQPGTTSVRPPIEGSLHGLGGFALEQLHGRRARPQPAPECPAAADTVG